MHSGSLLFFHQAPQSGDEGEEDMKNYYKFNDNNQLSTITMVINLCTFSLLLLCSWKLHSCIVFMERYVILKSSAIAIFFLV